jgi:hypothetical protein
MNGIISFVLLCIAIFLAGGLHAFIACILAEKYVGAKR